MTVLLSIKPEFADKIFSGEKRFEFRRRVFGRSDVVRIVVYATKPVGKIIGEFEIAKIHSGDPSDIWARTHAHAGISEEFFSEYFSGKDCAHAIEVGARRRYEVPVDPREVFESFTAPQFFYYWHEQREIGARPARDSVKRKPRHKVSVGRDTSSPCMPPASAVQIPCMSPVKRQKRSLSKAA